MFERNENKKARKARNAQKRVIVPFNTGTRTHKSAKDWNKQQNKLEIKKGEW